MSKKRRYFDDLPGVKAPRANFNLSHRVATTMKPGLLHPIKVVEVLPGDTWTVDSAQLVKLVTPLVRPIMDDVYLDTYSFFVPLRLCYDKLEDVFGDSAPSAYESPDLSVIPSFLMSFSQATGTRVFIPESGTVYDYLGAITDDVLLDPDAEGDYNCTCSVLPVRAFALVWNEFFRNQQIDQEVAVNLSGFASTAEKPNNNDWSPTNYGGKLPPVRRYGDYFSTCMLAPQKGPAVKIPIEGTPIVGAFDGSIPVITPFGDVSAGTNYLAFSGAGTTGDARLLGVQEDTYGNGRFSAFVGASGDDATITGSNMVVGANDNGTINALRTAFQLQKYLERDAFYGSRYREYLYASYGVISQDARVQVPEFLAGTHNRLQISQIMSTASTDKVPLGQFSGQISSLSEKNLRFSKSIPEHGYIITVAAIRYKHLYSQAVQKLWFRFRREDFYDKLFSNLGQKAIGLEELVGINFAGDSRRFLGYQENFAEYRTIFDSVTGQMRPLEGKTGQYWSLADRFAKMPSLSDVVHEQTDSFDRVLAVTTEALDPFIVDFNFRCSVARVVSPYSMPGFADHH
jgi:hypothetical protein